LKRVTGISVESGKYIYVRGLSDRYSKTTLNGAEIPGLDPDKNSVQMDLFPSNLIENMVVHKTFSPDLPGDFTGGVVDIITRDFPMRFTLQFSASLGFNPSANLNKNFLTYKGGKTDWLGFDDGTRDFPVIAGQIVPKPYYGRESDQLLGDVSRAFNRTYDLDSTLSFFNQNYAFSMGDQLDVASKVLGYNLALSYSRSFDYFDDGLKNFYEIIPDGEMLNPKKLTKDMMGDDKVVWSAMLNSSLKLNNYNKLGFRFMRNQGGQASSRYNIGSEPDESKFIEERTLGYQERSLTSFQVNGKSVFPGRNNLSMDWFSSYTLSTQAEPDFRLFFNDYEPNLEIRQNKEPKRESRNMEETNWDTKLNFTMPFTVAERNGKFKFGGSYVTKDRVSEANMYSLYRQGRVPYNWDPEEYVAPEHFIDSVNNYNILYYLNDKLTNQVNSYVANQEVLGAYAMIDLPLLDKLRLVAGARYELSRQFVENYVDTIEFATQKKKYQMGDAEYKDFLPSVNVIYTIVDNMNLRFAFSQTLARPVFRELAPYASWDFKGGYRKIGNPDLKRTTIDNFDLRWEYFFAPGEIFSISGFYKLFSDPIEQRDSPITNNPEITYENIPDSRLYGIESEFRKSLGFVPALENVNLGLNFTYIYSEMEEDSLFLVSARKSNSDYPAKREMFGQSPWIINSYLGYQNDSVGLKANLVFNAAGPKILLITKGGLPNVYEQPCPMLDFNISKTIAKNWSLKFSVKNILNSEFKQTYSYRGQKYYFLGNYPGREFGIGISYRIN
jgi:outer membrane receptor protein involved in Fe transport